MGMSLHPMKQVRTVDKPMMDLQTNVNTAVTQIQQQALAESRFLTLTIPTTAAGLLANAHDPSGDINLQHGFGRPAKGYFIAFVPLATQLALTGPLFFIYASPTANPSPNSIAIIRCNTTSPVSGIALTFGVIVF
jgi:hypothetical protein